MTPAWAQRREEMLSDCLVSPDVFTQMVDQQIPRNSRQNSRPSKQADQAFLWLGSIPFRFKFSRGC